MPVPRQVLTVSTRRSYRLHARLPCTLAHTHACPLLAVLVICSGHVGHGRRPRRPALPRPIAPGSVRNAARGVDVALVAPDEETLESGDGWHVVNAMHAVLGLKRAGLIPPETHSEHHVVNAVRQRVPRQERWRHQQGARAVANEEQEGGKNAAPPLAPPSEDDDSEHEEDDEDRFDSDESNDEENSSDSGAEEHDELKTATGATGPRPTMCCRPMLRICFTGAPLRHILRRGAALDCA